MPSPKLKLAFIDSRVKRENSCKKRSSGLVKKVSELSTICGVDASVIIYNRQGTEPEPEPEPEPDTAKTKDVLTRFMTVPSRDRREKMVDQKGHSVNEFEKSKQKLENLKKTNKNKMVQIMNHSLAKGEVPPLSFEDLSLLKELIGETMKEMQNNVAPQRGYNGIRIG